MDISSTSGALIISILRLLHIVAGLIWVGAAIMMSFYVEPSAERSGADGAGFLRALYSKTNYARMVPAAAIITTLAGLLLYGMMSYHEAMNSAMGHVNHVGRPVWVARLRPWLFRALAQCRNLRGPGR